MAIRLSAKKGGGVGQGKSQVQVTDSMNFDVNEAGYQGEYKDQLLRFQQQVLRDCEVIGGACRLWTWEGFVENKTLCEQDFYDRKQKLA